MRVSSVEQFTQPTMCRRIADMSAAGSRSSINPTWFDLNSRHFIAAPRLLTRVDRRMTIHNARGAVPDRDTNNARRRLEAPRVVCIQTCDRLASELPVSASSAGLGRRSTQRRFYDRGERRASPVQARLHRAKVAVRDLRDLLVRLALKFAKHEYLTMVLRQSRDRFVDELAEVALPIHIVGPRGRVLELQRPVVLFVCRSHRLEEH